MEILGKNLETTNEYNLLLKSVDEKFKALRIDIRDKIAETATTQAKKMLENTDDIGNPEVLCDEISKLRLKYTEIIVKEKEEKEKIMDEYMKKIIVNMGNPPLNTDDSIKLRVYEKYIQTPLNSWDLPNGIVWPQNGWQKNNYNNSTTGVQWLNNFKHTINTKIQEERKKN